MRRVISQVDCYYHWLILLLQAYDCRSYCVLLLSLLSMTVMMMKSQQDDGDHAEAALACLFFE